MDFVSALDRCLARVDESTFCARVFVKSVELPSGLSAGVYLSVEVLNEGDKR